MRSDRHDSGKKSKRRDTVSEDFLAEFRNLENSNNNESYSSSFDDSKSRKDRKKSKEAPKKKKSKGGKKKKRRILPKILVVLLLLLGVGVASAYFFLDAQIEKFDHVEIPKSDLNIDKDVAKDLKNYKNIAVLGIDARKGEDPTKCRTDAIIIATVNNKNGDIKLTSVMRDSYMLMDDISGNELLDKATHAHAFGGPINTIKMLNQTLDLNVEKFVVMDWNSVADVVDSMGGITINVQENELRDLNKWGPETARNTGRKWNAFTKTGKQEIDGAQAATYCRIRKTSGGDPGRTNRMKKVMTALLSKAKSNPTKINDMADKVFPEIRTNLTTSDFMSLLPKVVKFNLKGSEGYPYNYWGGILNGKWLAVPTTLEYNVKTLHEKLFDQKDYNPSNTVKELSQRIISNTGISVGTEVNE